MVTQIKRVLKSARKQVSVSVSRHKKNGMVNYSLRITVSMLDRIDRAKRELGPRFQVILGRPASRSDIFRAIVDRGLRQLEQEFGIGEEHSKFILEDDLDND